MSRLLYTSGVYTGDKRSFFLIEFPLILWEIGQEGIKSNSFYLFQRLQHITTPVVIHRDVAPRRRKEKKRIYFIMKRGEKKFST